MHFKYIARSCKGYLHQRSSASRREDDHLDPKPVADFFKEVRLPETSRRSSMCATASTYGRDDDLTPYLYPIDMSK